MIPIQAPAHGPLPLPIREAGLHAEVATAARIDAISIILDMVCRITGMGFAAFARVTETHWIACNVRDTIGFGLSPGGELQVATTLCDSVRASREALAIDQVATDARYHRHPSPALYGFQSYISVPIIRADGSVFGTLSALDPRPAQVDTPETRSLFQLLAQLIAFHLDSEDRLAETRASLEHVQQQNYLREQFIAVLGHDLRNPLAAVGSGLRLLGKDRTWKRAAWEKVARANAAGTNTALDNAALDKAAAIICMMQRSVSRMSELVNYLLDFAREKLGDGMPLNRDVLAPLGPTLQSVVTELRATWPGRVIEAGFGPLDGIDCDHGRIGQLFANLLGNALAHGAADQAVRVEAVVQDNNFELAVINGGAPIPPEMAEQLFQPFFRGAAAARQQGLGLGLYIATAIARAHGGTLNVASDAVATRFAFRMPVDSGLPTLAR